MVKRTPTSKKTTTRKVASKPKTAKKATATKKTPRKAPTRGVKGKRTDQPTQMTADQKAELFSTRVERRGGNINYDIPEATYDFRLIKAHWNKDWESLSLFLKITTPGTEFENEVLPVSFGCAGREFTGKDGSKFFDIDLAVGTLERIGYEPDVFDPEQWADDLNDQRQDIQFTAELNRKLGNNNKVYYNLRNVSTE